MQAEPFKSKTYCQYLIVLGLVFFFRVVAQFIQAFNLAGFLPAFSAWHSGSIPYPLLLGSQLIIVFILVRTTWELYKDRVTPRYKKGKALLIFGGAYLVLMLIRLLLGLFFLSNHSWFGAIIPAVFHMVLALFIIIYGHYHYHLGRMPAHAEK